MSPTSITQIDRLLFKTHINKSKSGHWTLTIRDQDGNIVHKLTQLSCYWDAKQAMNDFLNHPSTKGRIK